MTDRKKMIEPVKALLATTIDKVTTEAEALAA